jgi:hypothetical protein
MAKQGDTRSKQGNRKVGAKLRVEPGSYRMRAEPGSYRIVGSASDGVKILAPKTKPTHFTRKEIRQTIDDVVRDYLRPKG